VALRTEDKSRRRWLIFYSAIFRNSPFPGFAQVGPVLYVTAQPRSSIGRGFLNLAQEKLLPFYISEDE